MYLVNNDRSPFLCVTNILLDESDINVVIFSFSPQLIFTTSRYRRMSIDPVQKWWEVSEPTRRIFMQL